MDNNEAKFILQAYRPNGADAASPDFAGALEQARQDPTLRLWFEREQACDQVIAAKLRSVALPPGLRDSIITGAKFTANRRPWWRRSMWLAMAASMALLVSLGAVWRYGVVREDWAPVVAAVMDDAAHGERHGSTGAAADHLVAMLSDASVHLSKAMPIDLGRLKADGCRTLKVGHRDIMEVCFERNGAEFHFYVMKRSPFSQVPGAPRFASQHGIQTVLWGDPGHVYVLAGTQGEGALKALL